MSLLNRIDFNPCDSDLGRWESGQLRRQARTQKIGKIGWDLSLLLTKLDVTLGRKTPNFGSLLALFERLTKRNCDLIGKSFLDMPIKISFAIWQIRKSDVWDHFCIIFVTNCRSKYYNFASRCDSLKTWINFQLQISYCKRILTTKSELWILIYSNFFNQSLSNKKTSKTL